MQLKIRFVLYLFVFFIFLGVMDGLVDHYVVVPKFKDLEFAEAKKNLNRCHQAIKRELVHLSNLCHDWAAWDDTYDFVDTLSEKYMSANLLIESFSDNRLNLIFIINTKGEVAWGRVYDLDTLTPMSLKAFPEKGALQPDYLYTFSAGGRAEPPIKWITSDISGILTTEKGPMLVASRPILTSANKGPAKGAVIMGRLLTREIVSTLSHQTEVNFDLVPISAGTDSSLKKEIYLDSQQPDQIVGKLVLPDIQNQPAYVLTIRVPVQILDQAGDTVVLTVFTTMAGGLCLLVFLMYLIQVTILSPIKRLTRHLSQIEQTGNLSLRLNLNRKDEIGFLSDRFDLLLDMIQKKDADLEKLNREMELDIRRRRQVEEQLAKTNRFLDNVMDAVNAGLCVKDESLKWTLINSKAARLFEISQQTALGKSAGELGLSGPAEALWAAERRALETGDAPAIELSFGPENDRRLYSIKISRFSNPVTLRSYVISIAVDITDRRRLEDRLRENEERLKLCLVGAEDGIWDLNMKTLEMYYDRQWIKMLGYDPQKTQITFEWWYNHLHPKSREDFAEAIAKYEKQKKGYYELEYRIQSASGGYKWIWARGKYAAFDESGTPLRMLGTHRDITDRRELEEAFFQNERKYRLFIENFRGIAFQGDMNFNILFIQGAIDAITGYTERHFIENKMSWREAIHPQDRRMYVEITRDLERIPDFAITVEYRIVQRSGQIRWVQETIQNLCDENRVPHMVQGVVVDITEKKEAEKERFFLNTAVEQTEEGILVTDHENRVVYANPAFEKITGFPKNALMKRRFVYLIPGLVDRTAGKRVMEDMAGGTSWSGRFSLKSHGGPTSFLSGTISPVRDFSGEITHHTVLIRDITHELEMERQITQKQKLEAIGALAGGIAHDFNNILMSLMLNMEIALLNPEPNLVSERLKLGLTAANRAKDLVKQILTFSRKSEEEVSPMEMVPVVKETIRMLRASLPSFIEIRTRITPGPHVVLANPSQIQQILINLFTNAAHAMKEQGGMLSLEMDQVVLTDTSDLSPFEIDPGPVIRLEVRDTGAGIAEEIKSKIFDPFFTTKNVGEGTGMGLSVVHGILLRLNGAVKVESSPDKGSRFTLFFPVAHGDPTPRIIQPRPRAKASARLLIVDDEPLVAESLAASLSQMGYRVQKEFAGDNALKRISGSDQGFDLIITDMVMPEMSGMELARRVHDRLPDLPVILCTGYNSSITPEKMRAAGISRLIQKPVAAAEMDHLIRELLNEGSP